MEPVIFTLSETDMIAGQRDGWRGAAKWQKNLKLIALLSLAFGSIGLFFEWQAMGIVFPQSIIQNALTGVVLGLLTAAVIFCFSYITMPFYARKLYHRDEVFNAPVSVHWDGEGIYSKNEFTDSHVPWGAYMGWLNGNDNLLLYQNDLMFIILPKRVFSVAQLQQIIEFLKAANVPQKHAYGIVKNPSPPNQ